GLGTADEVAAQAERMLQDPRAATSSRQMLAQWLGVLGASEMNKTDAAFTAAMARSMETELDLFLEKVVFAGNSGLTDLFTSPSTFIDANLAALYGVPAPSGSGM